MSDIIACDDEIANEAVAAIDAVLAWLEVIAYEDVPLAIPEYTK